MLGTPTGNPASPRAGGDRSPSLPDYAAPVCRNLVPALLEPERRLRSGCRRRSSTPTGRAPAPRRPRLGAARRPPPSGADPGRHGGGPITTVLPTTTATALTSLSTGMTPGEHGVVGYRMHVHGEVLNVLRWTTAAGDARQTIPPRRSRPTPPSSGTGRPVVTRSRVRQLRVHRRPPRRHPAVAGTGCASTLVTEVRAAGRRRRAVRVRLLRRASTRSPTSTASASTTTPSCGRRPARRRPARRAAPRARRWWSRPTTARSTSVPNVTAVHPR